MVLKTYKTLLPIVIILGAGFGKSLKDGAAVGKHPVTRQMMYQAVSQQTLQFPIASRRRIVRLLPAPYSSYRRQTPSPSRSGNGNIAVLLYLLLRDASTSILSGLSNLFTPTSATVIGIEAQTCTVSWGSWTDCNFEDSRYRDRQCPNGLETEKGDCSIECMSWGAWTTCSTPEFVDEQRSRIRQCDTGFQTQQEDCYPNTAGFTSDGWYRFTNGYEYKYISTTATYEAHTSACSDMDSTARLATVAARSGDLSSFDGSEMGVPDGTIYFVGGSDSITEDTWIFQDSVVQTTSGITTWATGEPNTPAEDCLVWLLEVSSLNGLADAGCATSYTAMCERPIA